jgi:hypothetical protein
MNDENGVQTFLLVPQAAIFKVATKAQSGHEESSFSLLPFSRSSHIPPVRCRFLILGAPPFPAFAPLCPFVPLCAPLCLRVFVVNGPANPICSAAQGVQAGLADEDRFSNCRPVSREDSLGVTKRSLAARKASDSRGHAKGPARSIRQR